VRAAADLHARAGRENLFIKIPGTAEGLPAIEEATFGGVPVNGTLLFSPQQYLASADAYMRGIERRIEAGLDPSVPSVASVFISRWDAAVIDRASEQLRARLGLAVGLKTYQAYRQLMDSARWQRLANAGARVQRLLWASTSTKDPNSPDMMYIDGLRAPHTINTMPESTLRPSTTMVASVSRSRPTAAMRRQRWPSSNPRASMSTRWPRRCSPKEPATSSHPGMAC
jgi:transaldolase